MRLKILAIWLSIFLLASCDNRPNERHSQQVTSPQTAAPNLAFQQGIAYTFNSTYQCTPAENKSCVTAADYETLCKQASGLTLMGAKLLTSYDHVGRELLEGGSVDNIAVEWNDGSKSCRAFLTVSGIYQGNSTRRSYAGEVYEFIVNDQKNILGSATTNPVRTNY